MADEVISQIEALKAAGDLAPRTQDYLRKLFAGFVEPVGKRATTMHYGEQTKYVTWEAPEEFDKLELLQVTDMQFGHRECKYKRVVEYRDWVLAAPNRFMFWTGDNVDAWGLWSPGTAWDQLFSPQSQVYKFVETWAPAAHRILGYVGGNHERRAIPIFGDLGVLIATLLRIPYSNGKQLIDIHFGKHAPFKTTLWHGTGGARTKGTVAQTLHRFMSQGDSQLYLMGHLHQAMVIPDWKEFRDGRGNLKLKKCIGAIGTSFLETWGTYGEVAGFSSSDVMMAAAQLEKDGHWQVSLR